MRNLLPLLCASLLALGATSCGTETGETTEVEPFEPGEGQEQATVVDYPAGPFGIEIGSVIENLKFRGYAQPQNGVYDTLQDIYLADFYNPTGDGRFAADSQYGDRAKPKALLIAVSAVWCGPCQYENQYILPGEHAKYGPQGAEFLLQLADGPSVGKPAEQKHLETWVKKYKTAWPAVVDPGNKLSPLFEADAFPANLLINTMDMTIVDSVAGVPEEGGPFFDKLEGILAQ